MTRQDLVDLKLLTQEFRDFKEDVTKQLDKNTQDTAEIKATINSWNGGKKALIALASAASAIGIILATLYAGVKYHK